MAAEAVPLPRLIPSTPPPTQQEVRLTRLVERIKGGDAQAFDELYRLTREDVARTLYHLVGARRDLEDLIQESYLALMKALPKFRGESQVRTFIYRICSNVALMSLRWWKRRPEELTDEVPEELSPARDPEQEVQSAQARRLVHKALQSMSPKKRVVFVYYELCGMGPEEIAQATSTTYNTVRSRLHSARQEFTEALRALVAEEVTT